MTLIKLLEINRYKILSETGEVWQHRFYDNSIYVYNNWIKSWKNAICINRPDYKNILIHKYNSKYYIVVE